METVINGTIASLLAGLCTGIGALGVFAFRQIGERLEDVLLSSAAGIMLAATFFSLIAPGIAFGETQYGSTVYAVLVVIAGIMSGGVVLWQIHRHAPHEHFIAGREGPEDPRLSRIWLFVIAITLHNFPEGMAVGVGYAAGDGGAGPALAVGIGLQNIPEGLAIAAALVAVSYSKGTAFTVSLLSGLLEPFGGFIGASAVWLAQPVMPYILGLAGGAMLFIISDEIIPETHSRNNSTLATFSLMGGFVVMMFLDATLG